MRHQFIYWQGLLGFQYVMNLLSSSKESKITSQGITAISPFWVLLTIFTYDNLIKQKTTIYIKNYSLLPF